MWKCLQEFYRFYRSNFFYNLGWRISSAGQSKNKIAEQCHVSVASAGRMLGAPSALSEGPGAEANGRIPLILLRVTTISLPD